MQTKMNYLFVQRKLLEEYKQVARDLNIPIVMLLSLPNSDDDSEPTLSDFKKNMIIPRTADVVYLLHRDRIKDDRKRCEATLITGKDVNGQNPYIHLYFYPETGIYTDFEDGFDDIIFSENADIILKEEFYSKSTCTAYQSLIESVSNNYQKRFVSDLQTYITRLGFIINKIAINKKFYGENNYSETLKYICKDILSNDYLYDNLIKIYDYVDDVKHSIKNINVNIKDFLLYYNSMIDSRIEFSSCKSFSMCYIN